MSYELDFSRKKLVFLNLNPDEGAWLQKAFELACYELCARGIYIHIYIYEEIVKDFDRMESKEKRQRWNNTWSEELPISKSCI